MNAYEELLKRKEELRREIGLIEGEVMRSVGRFNRFTPRQVIVRATHALFVRFLWRTGGDLVQSLFGMKGTSQSRSEGRTNRSSIWRDMSHRGLDILFNYFDERPGRAQRATEEEE